MGIFSALSERFQEGLEKKISIEECIRMIEKLLRECKIDLSNAKDKDSPTWFIQVGSALIYIKLQKNEFIDDVTLEITSPILKLPNQNILPFYRRCLEINSTLVGCALCASEDSIMVTSERTLRGLDYQEVEDMLIAVANAADQIDDDLAEEFGAKLFLKED